MALHQNRPLDQVWILGHELQRLLARWGMVLHAAFAIQLVASIEEQPVITLAYELVQIGYGKTAIQIYFFKFESFFAKPPLRFPAGGSSRFPVEFHTLVPRRLSQNLLDEMVLGSGSYARLRRLRPCIHRSQTAARR